MKYLIILLVLLLSACSAGPQSKVLSDTALTLATLRFLERGTPTERVQRKETLVKLVESIENSLGTVENLNTLEFFISLVGKKLEWEKYPQQDKLVLTVLLQLVRDRLGSGKDVSVLAIREVLQVIKRSLATS